MMLEDDVFDDLGDVDFVMDFFFLGLYGFFYFFGIL